MFRSVSNNLCETEHLPESMASMLYCLEKQPNMIGIRDVWIGNKLPSVQRVCFDPNLAQISGDDSG